MTTKALTSSMIKQLASQAGFSDKAVERVFGSLKVPLPHCEEALDNSVESCVDKQYNLGLQLDNLGAYYFSDRELVTRFLGELFLEYRKVCPKVIKWIIRGDFNTKKIPDSISRADLSHAARTAGRLKAGFIRKMKSIS